MTMPDDLVAYNRTLIEQFRTEPAAFADRPLLLLTTVGRRTGEARTSPMLYVRSGDRLLVIASNAGAATDPLWYGNLIADPAVTVELVDDRFPATAAPLTGDDYTREWTALKQKFPFFADHEQKAAPRQIPVVGLTRR